MRQSGAARKSRRVAPGEARRQAAAMNAPPPLPERLDRTFAAYGEAPGDLRIRTRLAQLLALDPALATPGHRAAILDLVRDKQVLGAMVAEVAGETVADANAKEKGATLKKIIAAHLAGEDGRPQVTGWVPRWMRFPALAYTERGGVATVKANALVAAAKAEAAASDAEPDADALTRGDASEGEGPEPGPAPEVEAEAEASGPDRLAA